MQPILAKQLTPFFGGSPAVWTTCMLFFQSALVAGYGYAHGLSRLKRPALPGIHLCLAAASFLLLNLDLSAHQQAISSDSPIPTILRLLTVSAGLPFLLLAASVPLLQHEFIARHQVPPHDRTYALSNTGSLLALLSYPLLIEPRLDIAAQARAWWWLYLLYAILCGCCLLRRPAPSGSPSRPLPLVTAPAPLPPHRAGAVQWLACSFCGSAIMLAVTNQIGQQVAVIPLLWVVTLAIYLATFIICFGTRRATGQRQDAAYLVLSFVSAILALTAGNAFSLPVQLVLFAGVLFPACMLCHGQLASLRPAADDLTFYYLVIAIGGACGGVFMALVAPQIFTSYVELPFLLVVVCILYLVGAWRTGGTGRPLRWQLALGGTLLCCQILFSGYYLRVIQSGVIEKSRNFYGTLKVVAEMDGSWRKLSLKHGVIVHGSQYTDGARQHYPTTYYGPDTGPGLALRLHPLRATPPGTPAQRGLRVGLAGLGVGTLAVYGRPGDTFRFFEIDPTEIHLAREHFTFLRDSPANVDIVTGDARLSLEREARQPHHERYDVLVIDVFSSDTIPVHLITREAVRLYVDLLQPDGILLIHLTTSWLDLMPVLAGHAEALGMTLKYVASSDEPEAGRYGSRWAILSNNHEFLDRAEVKGRFADFSPKRVEWTDRFSSIWQVVK
jgi:hypothetical protein